LAIAGGQDLQLSKVASQFDELGQFDCFDQQGRITKLRCVRPREMRLTVPDKRVRDSSNATLNWNTQINPQLAGVSVDLPSPSRWETVVKELEFFTHTLHNPLEVRRFATSSDATVVFENGVSTQITTRFIDDRPVEGSKDPATPVGLGFAIDVDGIVVRFELPQDLIQQLPFNSEMLRSLRASRFRDVMASDPELNGIANYFQRQWLSQVYLSALTSAAIQRCSSLQQCWLDTGVDPNILNTDQVIGVIFQSLGVISGESENEQSSELEDVQQQLQLDLEQLLALKVVIDVLRRHAPLLWTPPDENWRPWLVRKFKTTLGAALLDGIQQLCSDLNADDLLLDVESGPRPDSAMSRPKHLEEIWITERTIGGGGVIESFLTRYGEDPRRFFELVENALGPSDYEIVDQQLTLLLSWVAKPDEVELRDSIARYRAAMHEGHNQHAIAFDSLRRLLGRRGLFTCHGVIAALCNRILRPGSSDQTDQLLHGLIQRWRQLESDLQIEIDPRIFAYFESENESIEDFLGEGMESAINLDRRQWRFNLILSLLWPRGGVSRSARLSAYNPFDQLPETEHDLVRMALGSGAQRVAVGQPEWHQLLEKHLIRDSEAILTGSPHEMSLLSQAMLDVMTNPIESNFMLLYPKVGRVDRRAEVVEVTLSLPESIQ
jgi:hypothetical protein